MVLMMNYLRRVAHTAELIDENRKAYAASKAESLHQDDELKKMRTEFDEYDKDNSGTVAGTEVRAMLDAIGLGLTGAEVDEIIGLFDEDGDGQISFDEFKAICSLRMSEQDLPRSSTTLTMTAQAPSPKLSLPPWSRRSASKPLLPKPYSLL